MQQFLQGLAPKDWVVETVGLELKTHHPVVELVSMNGERNFLVQLWARKHGHVAPKKRTPKSI